MFRSSSSLCERQIARCQIVVVVFRLVINWSSSFDADNDNHCIRAKARWATEGWRVPWRCSPRPVVSKFLVYVWRLEQRWKDYHRSLWEGCSSMYIADLFQFSPRLVVILPFTVRARARERESPSGECLQLSVSVVNFDRRSINRRDWSASVARHCVNVSSSLMIVLLFIPWNGLISEREQMRREWKMKNSFLIFVLFEWTSALNRPFLARRTCIDS